MLEITVDKKLLVPVGTVAEVYDTGLMGDKAIQLKLGNSSQYHVAGDTLRSATQNGLIAGIVDQILPPIMELVPSIDSTVIALKNVIESPEIKSLLKNADATMANLKHSTGKLDSVIDTVQYICNDLSGVTNSLNKVNWDSTMVSLEGTLTNLKTTTDKFNSTDNSIGALLNDKALYVSLDSTVNSANALLMDLKANPKRYVHFSVFGSKDKKEDKKEEEKK